MNTIDEMSPKILYKSGMESIRRMNDTSLPQGEREINRRRYTDFFEHGDNTLMSKYGINVEILNQYLNPETRKTMDRRWLKKCDAYEKEHQALCRKLKTIKESQLRAIVSEAVKSVLKENGEVQQSLISQARKTIQSALGNCGFELCEEYTDESGNLIEGYENESRVDIDIKYTYNNTYVD